MSKTFVIITKLEKKFLLYFYTFIGRIHLMLLGIKCKKVWINGNLCLDSINKTSLSIGRNVIINSRLGANKIGYNCPTIFQCRGGKVSIGDNVGISNSSFISWGADIIIEDNVLIGAGCKFYTSDFHSISYEDRVLNNDKNIRNGEIFIKEGAFIGAGSTILKNVTIGKHSIIGACSVVTKSVPDGEIWAGNPAIFIRKLK